MKIRLFPSPPLIGLDIQPTSIHLLQLNKIKNGYLAACAVTHELSENIFAEGKIKQWDVLRFALSDLVQMHRLHAKAVAIQLPANLVRMQQLDVPQGLSSAQIEAEIDAYIQNDLPGMTDILCIDYVELPKLRSDYSSLFFAAARKEYLLQYIDCVHASGLKVKIVDIDIYALKRFVSCVWQRETKENAVNAVLSMTHDTVNLIMFDAFYIRFHQHWKTDEAPDFIVQFRTRIQLFSAMFPEAVIQHLIVCGKQNRLILDELIHGFAFQVHRLDVFSHIQFASSDEANLVRSKPDKFVIAAGLAMRESPSW